MRPRVGSAATACRTPQTAGAITSAALHIDTDTNA